MATSVTVEKTVNRDETIEEILKSIKFKNSHGNRLVSYENLNDKVILTYEDD
jgi:hypothetical protein